MNPKPTPVLARGDRSVERLFDSEDSVYWRHATSPVNAVPNHDQSSASLYLTTNTDLSAFRGRGGKLMEYHGGSDSSVSVNATLRWYNAMNTAMGGNAPNSQG